MRALEGRRAAASGLAAAFVLASFASAAIAAPQQAPTTPATQENETPGARARRLTRLLELPERRTEAWRGLLALRDAAAPPLALALQDPRPDVAVRAAWVLGLLERDAEMALPALQRAVATGKDAQVVYACRWALERLAFRGTLLTDYEAATVVLLDDKDVEQRRLEGLSGPWFAEPTPGGNWLVTEYHGNRVRELDAKGAEVWSFKDLSTPYTAQRLPNGNTLISDAGNGRVVEVGVDGKVVWERKDLRRPVAAERLPDGHTLIAEQEAGRVHEVDAQDRVVFEVKNLERPQRAQRLPDGNTLIAVFQGNSVIEVDPTGKAVGEPLAMPQAQMALRRADGHTLIAGTKYWVELDARQKEVWRREGRYGVGILRR
jgi:hypothetical protein